MKDELLYRDECYRIVGACMAVHQDKGNGFVEPVYQDALEIELELSAIPFDPHRNYPIHYRGRMLKHTSARSTREFRFSSPTRMGTHRPYSPLTFAPLRVLRG